ncbi:sigma-70 family RNA polymerase sigma factor [uncultured Wocania sp.]|uniref:RNA polymerase sigma factor n=1 Tax=uncultured Wocania sp. TaxID=2834404 RepID=UPI0030FC4083
MNKELESLFLKILEQNQQKLFRICSVYSKNPDDTKDLFQEVLINIWKSLPSFEYKSSIETWVYRITLNTCLRFRSNDIKKQKRFISTDNLNDFGLQTEVENEDQKEKLVQLRHCINTLNKGDKAIISLYLEKLPYKEISNITGITENNVAVKIKRIKKKLLNCINKTL